MDKGHEMTDALIKECEKRVKKEYEQAYRETQRKLRQYWKDIEGQAAKKREQWQAGEISEKDYTDWLRRKAGMGKRWEDMRDNLAQDYYSYNQIARSIVKGYQPDAYALNHNFATYQIEHDGGIDTFYSLYDRQTVERLIREDQILMPEPSEQKKREIARNKDMQWNHQQLQSALTQGILQGETIPQLADRIANTVSVRNYNSSVRYARTMMTSAQNAGRYDGYRRAKRMGIDLTIEWSATLDGRTRHDHRMMHGQRREVDEPFETPDGFTILYPADCTGESDVPQQEIWNCRCTLLAWVKGFEGETVKSSPKMGNMSFEEWQNAKAPKKPEGDKDADKALKGLFGNDKIKKAMGSDYEPFINKINSSDSRAFYNAYADKATRVTISANGGGFSPRAFSVEASYRDREGMDRYSTVAHEFGHLFDSAGGRLKGLHFNEVDLLNAKCKEGLLIKDWNPFDVGLSTSDEFLAALRKDMSDLSGYYKDYKVAWSRGKARNASAGIQDALDGFFSTQKNHIFAWGHGDPYYNRIYNRRIKGMGIEKEVKETLTELGMDASNQAKVKRIVRQYETASEAWANVSSAVTCGGDELELMERHMPNCVEAYRKIAKMVGGE